MTAAEALPAGTRRVRVTLPAPLRALARLDDLPGGELLLELADAPVGGPTLRQVLDALEARHPELRGTIRSHDTLRRRPFVRFYACRRDLSHAEPDAPLPPAVCDGVEPLRIVGAMAGG
jgi:hypothetical protein